MIASVAKALDWVTIQIARRSPQRGLGRPEHAASALASLASAEFFRDQANSPENFKINGVHDFEFASAIETPWPENNRAYGRLYRCGDDWQTKPTVILIHGWNGELNYYTLFPQIAKELALRQHNAALLILPYHAGRRPSTPGAMRNYISDDVPRVLEATQQAVADMRALGAWLHAQGCPRITTWGFSLGGWLTGIVACVENRPQRYVLGTPIVSMQRATSDLPFCEPLCEALNGMGARLNRFDLTAMKPKVPSSEILLAEAVHDLFAPAEAVEELWRAWNQPAIMRFPHGHISVLFSRKAMKKIIDWVVH